LPCGLRLGERSLFCEASGLAGLGDFLLIFIPKSRPIFSDFVDLLI